MTKLKLDLVNSRIEIPPSARVYDSLEDRSLKIDDAKSRNRKTLVRMAPNNIAIKSNARREHSKTPNVRLDRLKLDRRGQVIEIQDRVLMGNGRATSPSLSITSEASATYYSPSPIKPSTANSSAYELSSPYSLLAHDGLLQQVLSGHEPKDPKNSLSNSRSRDEAEAHEEDLASLNEEEKKKFLRKKKHQQMQLEKRRQKEKEAEENYHPTLDKLRDKLYEDTSYTIANRINSKKLPGASWSDVERIVRDSSNPNTGPGYYEVYSSATAVNSSSNALKFNNIPREKPTNVFATSERIINSIEKINFETDLEYFPLQEKLRITRQIHEMQQKYPKLIELKTKVFKDYMPPPDYEILRSHVPKVSIAPGNRFDSAHYKQEPYVKTSGLILSGDYDKKFDKRIPFSFNQSTYAAGSLLAKVDAESKDVDVDSMKYFEMKSLVMKSPINYATVFRSSAQVGLQIPPPTTAPHVGPGTFNPRKVAIEVKAPHKPSYAFLAYKPPLRLPYSPDTFQRVPSFSEIHTKGPIFSDTAKESTINGGSDTRNRHMQNLVKEKMSQIYPRLAKKKFSSSNELELERGASASDNRIGSSASTERPRSRALTSRSKANRNNERALSLGNSTTSLPISFH